MVLSTFKEEEKLVSQFGIVASVAANALFLVSSSLRWITSVLRLFLKLTYKLVFRSPIYPFRYLSRRKKFKIVVLSVRYQIFRTLLIVLDTGCPVNKWTLLLTCSSAGQHASATVSISKEAHTPGLSNEGLGDPIRQFLGTLEPIF